VTAAGVRRVHERPFVVLSDGVITLRCLELADAAAHLAGEDEDQVRWLNEGHRSVPERRDAWIRNNRQEWIEGGPRRHFGIRDAAGDALVGNAEANLALPELAPGEVNITYAVFPEWRGRGLAARAVGLLCTWLSAATDARIAVIRVHRRNEHSHGVALTAGFVRSALTTAGGKEDFVRYERRLERN
jgi:RimJ/RimL family protein N-acetyltransferase